MPFLWIAAVFLGAPGWAQQVPGDRPPLQKSAYRLLPLGSVKPQGLLKRQLEIQAAGLTGHLDEFWPDLGPNSGWLGGTGESWERGPYYVDGLVPLAYLLDDAKLIAKARKWIGWTLANQRPDGGIGPAPGQGKYAQSWQAYDWWPNMVMLKALTQYQEATGDERVVPLMRRYFAHQAKRLAERPLEKWAVFRWPDEVVSILWLYNRTGDASLLDLARTLQRQGHDWRGQFEPFLFTGKMEKGKTSLATHVVNNAMALKTSPVWWLVSGDQADRTAFYKQLAELDRHHLLANGVHSGDEHYAGLDPSQGTELCAVVEAMFSLEHAIAIFGDAALGDRLEKIAYNPLPGTFSGDMWSHQYDQQPNQVLCDVNPRAWTTNGPDSNLFGLEPNFGCCTSNMHQGWPKYAANLWMATADGGLAAVAYGPSRVTAPVNGGRVTVTEDTEYPFRDRIRFTVEPSGTARFPIEFRIPGWAARARLSVNGKPEQASAAKFHRVDRKWKRGDQVELVLPMDVRVSRWIRDSVAVERGPLVYSLKIGEDWRKLRDRSPTADWEVHPASPWNYALLLDERNPAKSFEVMEKPVGRVPYSPAGAPVEIRARGRRLPEWKLEGGSAGPVPQGPVRSKEPVESLTLIPYGSAKLRITVFPRLDR